MLSTRDARALGIRMPTGGKRKKRPECYASGTSFLCCFTVMSLGPTTEATFTCPCRRQMSAATRHPLIHTFKCPNHDLT